jgi:hypothetical protein
MSEATLLEFKAGKMTMNGTTVSADKRKGLVTLKNVYIMSVLFFQ